MDKNNATEAFKLNKTNPFIEKFINENHSNLVLDLLSIKDLFFLKLVSKHIKIDNYTIVNLNEYLYNNKLNEILIWISKNLTNVKVISTDKNNLVDNKYIINLNFYSGLNNTSLEKLLNNFTILDELYLFNCKKINTNTFNLIAKKFPNLKKININSTNINNISNFNNLNNLEEFNINSIDGVDLPILFKNCKKIKKITISNLNDTDVYAIAENYNSQLEAFNINITNERLDILSKFCNNLQKIKINCNIQENTLINLFNKCKNLIDVSLNIFNINDSQINNIINLKSLEKLNLSNCTKLTDNCITLIIQNCKQIKELNLEKTSITDKIIEEITNLHYLNKLNLSYTNISKITDIYKCRSLKKLYLKSTKIDDNSIINDNTHIESLDLSDTGIRSDISNIISKCKELKKIKLSKITLSNRTLDDKAIYTLIYYCKKLEKVDISYTDISEVAIVNLIVELNSRLKTLKISTTITELTVKSLQIFCTNLEKLSIWLFSFSNVSVEEFINECKSLRHITIKGILMKNIDQIKKSCRKIKIDN